jgi:hypothetical protein
MLPNLSQGDADGCLWICINPDCPELCAGELETEDLVEGGVPQALAARLVRLIDFYEDTIEELHARCAGGGEEGADAGGGGAAAPPLAGSRERAQADLASLRRQVRELRRRSALAAAATALCAAARHAAADAEHHVAGIDPELAGLLVVDER